MGITQHKGWDTKIQEQSFVFGPWFLFSLIHTQPSLLCNHLQRKQGYSDLFYLHVFWFISYFCQITYLQKLETNSTGDAILHRPKSSLIWFTFFLHLLVKIFQQAFKVKLDFFVKPSSPMRPYSQVVGDWLIWIFGLSKWQEVRCYKSRTSEWDQLKRRSSNTINSTRFKGKRKHWWRKQQQQLWLQQEALLRPKEDWIQRGHFRTFTMPLVLKWNKAKMSVAGGLNNKKIAGHFHLLHMCFK